MHSYAHFRYLGHGGWGFCILSRTSLATPSYEKVKLRGFPRVRQQSKGGGPGPLLSMGTQGEVHPLRVGTMWHLFIRAYPKERGPEAAPFAPGQYRMTWDPPTQRCVIRSTFWILRGHRSFKPWLCYRFEGFGFWVLGFRV